MNERTNLLTKLKQAHGARIPWKQVFQEHPEFKRVLEFDDRTPADRKTSMGRITYWMKAVKNGHATPAPETPEAPQCEVDFCPGCGLNLQIIKRAMNLAAKMKGAKR